MKICFTGSQSTGKSTLLEAVRKYTEEGNKDFEFFKDHSFITELVRGFKKKNVLINEQTNFDSQTLIFNGIITNLLLIDNFVTDRGLIDALSYTHWAYHNGNFSENEKFILSNQIFLTLRYIKKYDLIFYFPTSDINLVKDGIRSENEEYRQKIDEIIYWYLTDMFKIPFITLKGTVEERLNDFLIVCQSKLIEIKHKI